jgi:uncharacterized protein YecA (UPF0149 family)
MIPAFRRDAPFGRRAIQYQPSLAAGAMFLPFHNSARYCHNVMPLHAREKIGRNDPCPCGTGKKYKRCCLPGYATSIDHVWARQHEESDRLTGEITEFALRRFGVTDL